MKTPKTIIIALLLLFMTAISLADSDIVYLKNGSMIRGSIVLYLVNEKVAIKTADGSVMSFEWDSVEKIVQNEKGENLSSPAINHSTSPQKSYEVGATIGIWHSGTVHYDGSYYIKFKKSTDILFRLFADYYLIPNLATGVYCNFGGTGVTEGTYEGNTIDVDEEAGMTEFGCSFKPKFSITPDFAIKPGLNLGYRSISSDDESIDDTKGLAVNLSVEGQFLSFRNQGKKFLPHAEIGFLSQPTGGNDDADIRWAPIIYWGGGVTF